MEWRLVLPAVPLVAILLVWGLSWRYRVRLRKRLKAQWGADAEPVQRDILDDIACYWRARNAAEPSQSFVDDTTWNDLDMDLVFARVNRATSIAGSEALYAMLRDTGVTDQTLQEREKRVRFFGAHESERLDAQVALSRINKSHFHGASRFLYQLGFVVPDHPGLYIALSLTAALLIVAGFFKPELLFVLAVVYVVNTIIYFVNQLKWQRERCAVQHISSVLNCARALIKFDIPALAPELNALKERLNELRSVRLWCPWYAMEPVGPMDFVTEFIKMLFLMDMVSLCAITRGIRRHERALIEVYALVGELDACIAIAALRDVTPLCTEPSFHEALVVKAEEMSHPLIANPVPNSFCWDAHTLITGSNASGKSTFIKAAAINCILAQTIGTCFAKAFHMPRAHVMSSMAIRDSVLNGESYFVAEIKSLKRLLDAMDTSEVVLCFVDEILRGTNTIERIAASSSVLRALVGRNALCMTATHDIELTRILIDCFANWHFREEVTESGITFNFKLQNGPATSRNAIALLEHMDFAGAVIQRARDAITAFEQDNRWA